MIRSRTRSLIALFTLLGIATSAFGADDAKTVSFSKKFAAGTAYSFSQEVTSSFTSAVVVDGKKESTAYRVRDVRHAIVSVESVSEGGSPTKSMYKFDKDCGAEVKKDAEAPEPHPSTLAAATVTVTGDGETLKINTDATLDAEGTSGLKELIANQYADLLPAAPVKAGDEWKLDPAKIRAILSFDKDAKASGTGKLVGVEIGDKRRAARIKFDLSGDGMSQGGASSTSLAGEALFDVATSLPLKVKLSGPMKIGVPRADGKEQTVSGNMTIAVEVAMRPASTAGGSIDDGHSGSREQKKAAKK